MTVPNESRCPNIPKQRCVLLIFLLFLFFLCCICMHLCLLPPLPISLRRQLSYLSNEREMDVERKGSHHSLPTVTDSVMSHVIWTWITSTVTNMSKAKLSEQRPVLVRFEKRTVQTPAKRNTQTQQEKITITTKSIQENLHAAGKSAETFLADKMHLYAFVFLHVFALRLIIAEVKSIGVQHSWFLHVVTLYSSYCSIL